jgi:hypothetical protein
VLLRRKRMTIPFYSSSFAFAALIVSKEVLRISPRCHGFDATASYHLASFYRCVDR